MGVDWRFLSISGYIEAVEAHHAMNNPDGKKGSSSDPERLAAVMAARGAHVEKL